MNNYYLLLNKRNDLDNTIKEMIFNYFNVLINENIISYNESINYLLYIIDNLKNVIYYDENNKELLQELHISSKNKGVFYNNTLYIKNTLSNELKEITFYHELTHLIQSHNNGIGITQNNKWNLLMEGQTQILSELVYNKIHNINREIIDINSFDLRMIGGGNIKSNLKNYQLYDSIVKKICLFLNISIKDFMKINFMKEDSLYYFEDLIENKYNYETLDYLLKTLDIIYTTDTILYRIEGNHLIDDGFYIESTIDKRLIDISSTNQFLLMIELDNFLINNNIYNDNNNLLDDNRFILKKK